MFLLTSPPTEKSLLLPILFLSSFLLPSSSIHPFPTSLRVGLLRFRPPRFTTSSCCVNRTLAMVRNVQFANSSSSPGPTDDNPDFVPVNRGCCCWIPFLSRPSALASPSPGETTTWWGSASVSEPAYGSTEGPWWSRGWRRLRDAFKRRFSHGRMMMRRGGSQFRYDPLSYALNFDEGPGQNGEQLDRDMLSRDFSSRYASIPASCKSSMDLGHSGPLFM